MHLVFVLVGAVLAFAGALLVLYAVPVIDVAAAALFSSGIFAIVGALILLALAAVARGIDRIAERLEVQPLSAPAIPPIATVAHEEPPPRPARAEPVAVAPAPPAAPAAAAAPAPAATPAPAAAPAPAAKSKPSLLSAWLSRQAARSKPPAPPDALVALPRDAAPTDEPYTPPPEAMPAPIDPIIAPLAVTPAPLQPSAPPPPEPPPLAAAPIPRAVSPAARPAPRAPAPAAPPPEATVYKSGVIDGMAYTLFMDGSIEAELPQGRVRFASVDELQRYLTTRQ